MLDTSSTYELMVFLLLVVATNVPFGYLRRGYPRFSRPWARCLYIPIIINIVMRRAVGLTYKFIPFIVGAVLVGQFLGGTFRNLRKGIPS